MNDEILSPFRRNDYTWRERKQQERENQTLRTRFKVFCRKLKNQARIEYDPDGVEE